MAQSPSPDGFASKPLRHMPAEFPPSQRSPSRPPERKKPTTEVKDGAREVVETVVFVVVLVLLLKTFLAEAFVIPTGSMAPTLFGYHKEMYCEKCGYRVRVNASDEAERGLDAHEVRIGICQNCEYENVFPSSRQPRDIGGGP